MSQILTVNGGSSSIKFALYAADRRPPRRLLRGAVERIGLSDSVLMITREGAPPERQTIAAPDHRAAMREVIGALVVPPSGRPGGEGTSSHEPPEGGTMNSISAIGHRIVHGGPRYLEHCRIDEELTRELKRLSPIDPAHLPGEVALIEACFAEFPGVPQVACFDTAFHRDLPDCARVLPVPRKYETEGVRRYGFHGLSFTYLMEELRRIAPAEAAGRVALAHLGAGASLAAVRNGKCLDTTMSFTPTAGLVMGTRSGDLDPGFLTYLMRVHGMDADQIDELVNRRSGLLGLSGISSDMRDLLAREPADPNARLAVDIFCYQAKKWIGAFAAVLGGLDALVFSGGIGENSPPVRERTCAGLEFLGLQIAPERNTRSDAVISSEGAPIPIRVIRTDEELVIASVVLNILATSAANQSEKSGQKYGTTR